MKRCIPEATEQNRKILTTKKNRKDFPWALGLMVMHEMTNFGKNNTENEKCEKNKLPKRIKLAKRNSSKTNRFEAPNTARSYI